MMGDCNERGVKGNEKTSFRVWSSFLERKTLGLSIFAQPFIWRWETLRKKAGVLEIASWDA